MTVLASIAAGRCAAETPGMGVPADARQDSDLRYRPSAGAPAAWLFGIARNVVHAEWRRAGRERRANARIQGRRLLEGDDIARMQARIDAAARSRGLYAALDALPRASGRCSSSSRSKT